MKDAVDLLHAGLSESYRQDAARRIRPVVTDIPKLAQVLESDMAKRRGKVYGIDSDWPNRTPQWFKDMVADSYRPKHWQLRLPGF